MSVQPNELQRPPTADVGQKLRDKITVFDSKMVKLTQALEALKEPKTLAVWQCFWEIPEGVVALLERRRADLILARSAAQSILLVMERSADMRELLEALALLNRHDTSVPIFGLADFGPADVGPPAV